jgi:DNA-binding response OmpR family regulator
VALYHLLSIGADPSVLATRTDVLKRAGYLVSMASSEVSARQIMDKAGFDLIVVCHSLAPADRMKVIGSAKASDSRPKIISIHRGDDREPDADAHVHSLDGPDKLLETIASVLGEGTTRISSMP